jgi:putative ABC transport system permease protein
LPEKQYLGPERKTAFFRELLDRLNRTPGVRAAGLSNGLHPLGAMAATVEVPGNAQQDGRRVLIHSADDRYLRVYAFSLRAGRIFGEQEIVARRYVAVVNETFERRYSNAQSAIGRQVRVPRLRTPPFSLAGDSFEIIGVVGNVQNQIAADEILPEIFIPYPLMGLSDRVVILADSRAESLAGIVRAQVLSIDKNQPVTDVRTVETYLREWVFAAPRFSFILLCVFAGVGLALAVVGIYGVISNAVSRQTQELGVRIALGATAGDITSMVMLRGLLLLASGIALGLAASLFAVRLIENQISKVPKYDWISFAGTSLLLLAVGLFACYWPARRASRVDPIVALRYE